MNEILPENIQKNSSASRITLKQILSTQLRNNSFLCSALLLATIAFLLRLYRLGEFELWLDEAYTYRQTIVTDWLGSLLRDNSPPFYNVIMRGWAGLFGTSEIALRLPSVLFGTLFVFAACYAGQELFNRCTGLWCGLIAALSPIHLYYSQEARNYSFLILLLLLSTLFLVRAVRDEKPRDWLLATGCGLLSLYTHYLAGLALIPMFAVVLAWSRPGGRQQTLRTFIGYIALILVLFAPWLLWSFILTEHSLTGFDWMTPIWKALPPSLAIPRSFEAFTFLTGPHVLVSKTEFRTLGILLPIWLILPARIFLLSIFLWVTLPFGEKKLIIPDLGRKKVAVLALLLFPLIVLWGISYIRPLYVVSRYDMIVYPAFVLLFGLAFAKLQQAAGPLLFLSAVFCWFSASGLILYNYLNLPANSLKNATAQELRRRIRPGDVVVFTGNSSYTSRYYLEQSGLDCSNYRCISPDGSVFSYRKYPLANEDEEAVYNDDEVAGHPRQVANELDEFLAMRKESGATLWLVLVGRVTENKKIEFYYPADLMLLDEMGRRNISCQNVAPELLLLACRER